MGDILRLSPGIYGYQMSMPGAVIARQGLLWYPEEYHHHYEGPKTRVYASTVLYAPKQPYVGNWFRVCDMNSNLLWPYTTNFSKIIRWDKGEIFEIISR